MADDIQSNIRINVDTASAMDSIRLLQNQISAFHTQMSKMGAASAADSRNLQQNLVNSINSTGAFAANMTKVKTTAEQFTHSLEKNKLTMGEYFRYAGGATKSFGKLFQSEFETINKVARERVKDLQSQYIKMGRDANGAMQAIRVRPLTLDMESLATKTQIAAQRQQLLNQLLKQGSTNLLNFGKNTQWAGRQLMVGFTIPLSIMGGAALKAYKDIEEAGIRLRRVYGDLGTTNMETEKMVKDVQRLALEYTKYGVAVKDSMEMAATAAATGKQGADLLAQVASSARLAVLGGVDQQMALKTTISLTDAFGVSTKQLAKDINFLNAVENQTVLSIEDMTIAIPKAAPVIQQLGGDVKDLAFFLTAMKEGGINASESANALKSGLASLINPTNTASKMLQGFGINLRQIVQGNKGDVKKTVVDFAEALDKLDPLNRAKAIEQLFGKFQFARMSTLFKNVIEQGSQASEVLKLASTSSLELSMLAQRELSKIEQSPLYKFQKSIADFQAQLAPVGEQFAKALTPVINFAADVLKNFNGLGEGVKGFIVKFVAVAGVVGPVLLMSFGLIANAVANVIKGFALMKDIFNKTGKSSLSLGEQVNYMTNEQIQAAAIASSLDQVHSKLKQTFTSEAAAVDMLTAAYQRSVAAQRGFGVPITPRGPVAQGPIKKYAAGGIISGPGTGTSDSILAMVSNGEAIIPAASVARNPGMVKQLVSGNIPGYRQGKEGDVPTYGEYGLRLQNANENMRKQSSPATGSEILSFASMRIGESLGIKPSQSSVNKGLFDPIYKKYEQTFARYADKIKLEFDTTFSGISDTNERMRQARQTAARFVEKEAMQLSTSDTERLALRRSLGLDEDFYGSAPTMPRREGGKFLERARKSIYDLKTTGVRGYVSLSGGAKSLYSRMTGQSAENYQLGHYNDPRYVSGQELAKSPNLSNAAKKALESVGINIGKQAEKSIVAGVKTSTRQKSPSKDAYDAGANIGKGAIQGIQSKVDDAKNAGTQVGTAAAKGVSQSGRIAGQGGRRSLSDGNLIFLPGQGYVSEGQIARDAALANSPMVGPREGTRLEKFRAGMNAGSIYRNIQSADPDKLAGGIRNKAFGASGALAVGSMVVPGEMGQMMGMASMLTSFGGMGAGGLAKGLKSLSPNMIGLGLKFTRLIPYVGAAVMSFEAFDKLILPLVRKNADAFNGISETLSITKERIDGINNFFGTDLKLTGVRGTVIASGDQNKAEATIAQQFQQSEQFKNTYQESARKMQNLTDAQFKRAMGAMATDLFGQGMEEEGVTAIIDAIAIEAKKTRVSILPELFSLKNPEAKASMQKNVDDAFAQISEGTKGISPGGIDQTGRTLSAGRGEFDNYYLTPVDPESVAKIKAGTAEIASYMSALSGQFANGEISAKEFTLQYDKLISASNRQPGTSGIEGLKTAMSLLNAEIGGALKNLSKLQTEVVSRAILAGVTATTESLDIMYYGTEKQKQQQTDLFALAEKQALSKKAQTDKLTKQLGNLQDATTGIANTEQKINDKYDKRIAQIEKLKRLNDQLAKSQQGQLTLAEALNRGDIAAAARAAIDVQNNDIQASLDNQQAGLDAARKAEIDPLKGAQADNTKAIQNLTKEIQDLSDKGVTVKNADGKSGPALQSKQGNDPLGYLNYAGGIATDTSPFGLIKNIFGFFSNPAGFLKDKVQQYLLPGTAVDRNGQIVQQRPAAVKPYTGGHITGPGTGTSDSIPAMLSNGEYVIRANAVKTIGVNTLDRLNQADRIGFAAGGMVRAYRDGGAVMPNQFFEATPNLPKDKNGNQISLFDKNMNFKSAKAAEIYYTGLIGSRRAGVDTIESTYQKNLKNRWMTSKESNTFRDNNLIDNRTYGMFNGLDQDEAKVFALALSKLYGKKGMASKWANLGLSERLLSNKKIPLSLAERKYWNLEDKYVPQLSVNAPKFAMGGLVGYKDGGKVKNWDLKDPSAPWNQGDFKKFNDYQTRKQYWAMGQPGSRELVGAGKTAGYFVPGIGSGLAFGDAGTSFGKGDVAGGLMNTAFGFGAMWIPKVLGMIGKGFGSAKSAVQTGIATMNAKKVLGIMGGKEAAKLSPEVQVKMTTTGLQKFIGENAYKTLHQGAKSAAGDSPDVRNLVEAATGMSKALKLKPGQSPAYGYLGTKEAVPHYGNSVYGNNSGQGAQQLFTDRFNKMINPYGRGQQLYGSTVLNLKPSALRNATVSFGDSLSIYQQAVKAGVKTPQVMKLGSLLTTLRLSSMARKTKGILGKDFEMPYAEIHMRSGFGLDDVRGVGVSNEFKDRVPEAISAVEAMLAKAGRSDIPVYDIIGRGKNALDEIGQNIAKPMPKAPMKNPFAGMLSNLKKKPKPISYDTMFGPKTRGQGFDELNIDGVARERGAAGLLSADELHYLTQYVAKPYGLHGHTFGYAKDKVIDAILRNKFKIDKGTEIVRVANVHDMNLLKDLKPGQARVLDQFLSVANKNHPSTQNFIDDMMSGKVNTGGRGSGNYPLIKFNVKTDIPGINDINNIKSGLSDVSDGLLAPGTSLKLVKVTSSNGKLTYHVDLGTNIKAKYGLNQKGTVDYYKNLSDSLPAGHKHKQEMLQNALEIKTKPMDNSRMLDFIKSQGGKYSGGGMVRRYANGGFVMPSSEPAPRQFANGGLAMGTDTVPAMLTPGEFVIKKSAVDRIGPSALTKINGYAEGGLVGGNAAAFGESVYNNNTYEINVNVSSNSNPDQIANAVMTKIRQIDNGRVRGLGR